MQLCRHYVRELRRSVLIDTPELEKAGSKRSSAVLDSFNTHNNEFPVGSAIAGPSTFYMPEKQTPDQRLSAFLRSEASSRRSPQGSQGSGDSVRDFPLPTAPRPAYTTNGGSGGRLTPDRERPSPSSTNNIDRSPNNNNLYDSPNNIHNTPGAATTTVSRSELRASAQKILYTYLLPGSEREIILPQGILNSITEAIEQHNRDDPEVFDAAKDYVFQAMERDAFPGFLRSKALGNIVPPSMMLRLIVGLLSMFGGFWAAFVLIFMDEDRLTRLWVCTSSCPCPCPSCFLFTATTLRSHFPSALCTNEVVFFSLGTAHPPIHRRRLHARHAPVHARPAPRPRWRLRVYLLRLLPYPRAVRAPPACQAGFDRPGRGPAHRRRPVLSVCLCAGPEAMMWLLSRSQELVYVRE